MNGIAASDVLAQLERIVAHPTFASSGRPCSFLRFVVEEQLAGRGDEIKEYVIGVQVYRKNEAYDPRTDPTVRVDAGKLRARLTEYYEGDGLCDPVIISIPKGSYVPRFELRAPELVAKPVLVSRSLPRIRPLLVLGAALAVGGGIWTARYVHASPSKLEPATRILSLTSDPGELSGPSFSPDGSMVAFSWNGEKQDNFDIYVKVVDAPNSLRLTTDPARDSAPSWSPDGRKIAFLRNQGQAGEVYVVSALGGPEKRITASSGWSVGWTADSRNLLVMDRNSTAVPFAGFTVSVETGERKPLTIPPPNSINGDYDFVASPDGKSIAFCRMVSPPVGEIWLLPTPGGQAEKLAVSRRYLAGLAWTPDGRKIVFSSDQSGVSALWIVDAKPPAEPSMMAGVETGALRPSIPAHPRLDRVAYQRQERIDRLWHASLSTGKMSAPKCIVPSSGRDYVPQISPNGEWITFASDRSGIWELWLCRLDGSGLRSLTAGSGLTSGAPRWSPDGKAIVFDARGSAGKFDIYRIPAAGGPVKRMTWDKSEEVRPSWSADGRWIYFTSDRTGRREIWKMLSTGEGAAQVTREGGFEAFESLDGRTLYFVRSVDARGLWRMPSSGGKESLLLEGVHQGRWAVTKAGIYFSDSERRIWRREDTGKVVQVGSIDRERADANGLGVSRDGKEIVYVQPEPAHTDLRMAEGRLFE
jgi:Tol biopolymer transport system component